MTMSLQRNNIVITYYHIASNIVWFRYNRFSKLLEKKGTNIVNNLKDVTTTLILEKFRAAHCDHQQNLLLPKTFRPKKIAQI